MPTRNSLKYTRKKEDYYVKGETDWYNILYDHTYKTKEVDNIKDISFDETQRIYNHIPDNIKADKFSY